MVLGNMKKMISNQDKPALKTLEKGKSNPELKQSVDKLTKLKAQAHILGVLPSQHIHDRKI